MQKFIKSLSIIILIIMAVCLISGCVVIKENNSNKQKPVSYFHKGVYESYSQDKKNTLFYIFYDEKSGYTADSKMGIGLPFSCIQTDNFVKFKFGGAEEPEEVLKIKSTKNGNITGEFKVGQTLVFKPLLNVNSNKFDAAEYIKSKEK